MKIKDLKVGELYLIFGGLYVYDGTEFANMNIGGYSLMTTAVSDAKKATDEDILKILNEMVRAMIIKAKMDEVDRKHQEEIYKLNAKKSKILCDLWFTI